jgi:hypothetical protein
VAAVALAVIAVAVTVGLVLLPRGETTFTTFSAEAVPYTLEVPEEWAVDTLDAGDSSVTVLSPADVTGLFADDPTGMQEAADAVRADAGAVVGLAIYHRPRLDGNTPAAQLQTAEALLPGQDVNLRPGDRVQVGDLEATAMAGTMGLGESTSLQVRVLALESTPRQLLVFFAPPSVFDEQASTFDRVADSLDSTG